MFYQILVTIICSLAYWIWKANEKKSSLEPPELSGKLPIIGHILRIIGDRKYALSFIKQVSDEILNNGKNILSVSLGFRKVYVLCDPEDCSYVANVCLDKDYLYKFAKPLLSNGLTIADVPLWKQHRKLLNPSFRLQNLYDLLFVFNHQSKALVEKFLPRVGKGDFDHEKYVSSVVLESICMTAFGVDFTEYGTLHEQYLSGMNEILKIFTDRFQCYWQHSDILYSMSNRKKREDFVIKQIKEFTSTILKRKKAEIREDISYDSLKTGNHKPFMNIILNLAKESGCYTDDDILGEINTIVGGGYDTSICTLTFVLMLLGSHPEVQEKAYEEIRTVFQDIDRDVDKDDLVKLPYIEAILKETIRLYPLAPIVSRYLTKDIQLKDYSLRAGSSAIIHIWALHRHPAWGPDAELLKPDRWLDATTLPKNPNYFGGFSLGRRGCIGKTYAMMSLKTILVHLLRNYIIKSDISKLELEIDVILRPSSGQHISIEKRQNP